MLILFAVACITECAYANATSIYLGGWSAHLKSAAATNETHEFVVIEHDNYIAGTFINSYGDRTNVIGRKYDTNLLPDSDFNIAIAAAVTHGYYTCYGTKAGSYKKDCFMPVIELQYTKYDIAPTVLFIGRGAVLLFNVKF